MVNYELTVQNVEDAFGNVMELQSFSFSYVGIEELLLNGQMNSISKSCFRTNTHHALMQSKTSKWKYIVTDITGKQLISDSYTAGTGANKISYDFSGFSKGMYLLNIISEKGSLNYKLIVK